MSKKIVIVGAGGYVFPLTLIRDILAFPTLQDSVVSLYDPDARRVAITADGANRLIEAHGLQAKVEVPATRAEAFAGAEFVICTFQVGGIEAYSVDVEVPREYGIDQPVGDTLGPGGVFRGLRSIGALKEIAADMRVHCPKALLIQYANPMSINCWASESFGIKTVGLCHSVQHTSRMLADQIGVPYEEITFDSAGVNHTAWFTTFRRGQEDLIPRIRKVMTERHIHGHGGGAGSDELQGGGSERVRSELMNLTGYFHTESSHHASEYWPWFRHSADQVAAYIPTRWDYFQICSAHSPDHNVDEFIETSKAEGLRPSEEYGAFIIDSITTGTKRVIYGNVPNHGALVDNLAPDAIVEVACLVDGHGLRPIRYGSLPVVCAALNTVQINVQRLAVHGALQLDRGLVTAAVALDPMTGSRLTLPQVKEMVDQMFTAEEEWLAPFGW
jgi:alpha-galactosidase